MTLFHHWVPVFFLSSFLSTASFASDSPLKEVLVARGSDTVCPLCGDGGPDEAQAALVSRLHKDLEVRMNEARGEFERTCSNLGGAVQVQIRPASCDVSVQPGTAYALQVACEVSAELSCQAGAE